MIQHRFGLDGLEQYTLGELSARFGTTRERIRHIQMEALEHLLRVLLEAIINKRCLV